MVDAARLRRTKDIIAVRARGRARGGRLLSIRALPTDGEGVRIAVAPMRELGSAVRRNRARRRVREALRAELRAIPSAPSADIFVVARAAAGDASWDELRSAARAALAAALARP